MHPDSPVPRASVAFPADQWPDINSAIRRALLSAGCCRHDCDDIANDVALRMMTTAFDHGQLANPIGWAVTVATRIHLDQTRRHPRRPTAPIHLIPEQAGPVDTADVVEHRLDLTAVAAAVARLSAADRTLLLRAADSPPLDSCDRVRLHRIRKWLRHAAGLTSTAVLLAALGHVSISDDGHRHRLPVPSARHYAVSHLVGRPT